MCPLLTKIFARKSPNTNIIASAKLHFYRESWFIGVVVWIYKFQICLQHCILHCIQKCFISKQTMNILLKYFQRKLLLGALLCSVTAYLEEYSSAVPVCRCWKMSHPCLCTTKPWRCGSSKVLQSSSPSLSASIQEQQYFQNDQPAASGAVRCQLFAGGQFVQQGNTAPCWKLLSLTLDLICISQQQYGVSTLVFSHSS